MWATASVPGPGDSRVLGQLWEGPLGLTRERLASLLTGDSILNLCHIREVGSVGDAQAPHAMSMTPFLERSRGTM